MNATSAKGFTPLHIAAYHNRRELCYILLENGASAKLVDQNGNTGKDEFLITTFNCILSC